MSVMRRTYRRKAYMYGNTCSIRWIITRGIYLFLREYKMEGSTGGVGRKRANRWKFSKYTINQDPVKIESFYWIGFVQGHTLHYRCHYCLFVSYTYARAYKSKLSHFDRLYLIFTFCFHHDSFVIKICFSIRYTLWNITRKKNGFSKPILDRNFRFIYTFYYR